MAKITKKQAKSKTKKFRIEIVIKLFDTCISLFICFIMLILIKLLFINMINTNKFVMIKIYGQN